MQTLRRFRAQIILVIIALTAIALLLIAQGGEGSIGGPAPTTGGQYVEGLVGRPSRLNPLLDAGNQVDRDVNRLIFSSLFKFDSFGSPIPDLVESWGVSATGDVINIKLLETALWHDGAPVTSRDVLFTIQLMRFEGSPIPADERALWEAVEVIVFDDYNLQFVLPDAYSPFMDYLDFGILPEHLLGGKDLGTLINDAFNLAPVGSGPYQFDELITTENQIEGIVLSANLNYHGEGPFIEQIVFRYYDSTAAALEAYRAGTIMGIGMIEEASLADVLNEPTLNFYSGRLPQISMLLFNLSNDSTPYFQDAQVRRGLLMALNRPWMLDEILNGQGLLASGPVLFGSWAYYGGVPEVAYDPEAAVDVLRDAGWAIPADGGAVRQQDGFRMDFELVFPDTPHHTQFAEMIQEYWAAVGVRVDLLPVDYDTLVLDYLDTRTYEAALVDLDMRGSPDPDPYPFWHQSQVTGGQNYAGWDDRRASEYLERARVTWFANERIRLYRNFQVHFGRELPAIPLYSPVYNYAVSSVVQGISIGTLYDPADRFNNVDAWFLVAAPPDEAVIQTPAASATP
ncbi:MAG: peptide ABC transporter substrate-binding protein [Anaerolineae bacterium]|nr:MAG: peptide ABC transporter substrate-binding protein [Anaerolineae bacterium]